MKPCIFVFATLLAFTAPPQARADAVIDLNLAHGDGKHQRIDPLRLLIGQGKILLTANAGEPDKDLRFDQAQNAFQLIDHRHRHFMAMDEASVIRFTDQATQMLAMARGFSEQLALLPPKQRAKLENLIGDNPLAKLPKPDPRLAGKPGLRTATNKTVHGWACHTLEILGNGKKLAELCLSDAAAVPLAAEDYATLEAMRRLAQRLAQRAAPLAQQFGYPIPPLDDARLAGLPLEMKNLVGGNRETVTVTRISSESVAPQRLEIPTDYQPKSLSAFKF